MSPSPRIAARVLPAPNPEGRTSGAQRTPLERLLHIAASTISPSPRITARAPPAPNPGVQRRCGWPQRGASSGSNICTGATVALPLQAREHFSCRCTLGSPLVVPLQQLVERHRFFRSLTCGTPGCLASLPLGLALRLTLGLAFTRLTRLTLAPLTQLVLQPSLVLGRLALRHCAPESATVIRARRIVRLRGCRRQAAAHCGSRRSREYRWRLTGKPTVHCAGEDGRDVQHRRCISPRTRSLDCWVEHLRHRRCPCTLHATARLEV
mmetsp:Transcript_6332/g.14035  ORF Transcript_6332/g.14035 Transcript_6332/m.14035 type:complete len:266 (+) Transcript_6332:1273-2070(+)